MDKGQKKKKEKIRSVINASLISAGLFFFINPNIGLIDILPDFIGSVLILCGFLHFADIDDRAKQAQKALFIFTLVNIAKTLALLLLRNDEGTVWSLIFTFVFGILEGVLFVYAMLRLFSGLTYRAQRLDCPPLLRGFSALAPLTVLVAVLKNLLVILPELTKLSTDYGEVTIGPASSAQVSHFVYTALTILNVAVVAIYGIGWWIYLFRYFKTLKKERAFLEGLGEQYMEEVGSKPSVLVYRALKTFSLLVYAALLFLMPLYLDGVDYLPDFVAGILLILAALRLYKLYPAPCRRTIITGGVYTILAFAEWLSELLFRLSITVDYDAGYYLSARTVLLHYPERMSSYIAIISIGVFKYLALALFLFFLLSVFKPIIREHTGSAFELSSACSVQKDKEIKKKLTSLLRVLTLFCFALSGAGILRRILRMFSDAMLVEYAEWLGALPCALLFIIFLSKLQEGIDNKYYLEK